MNAKQQAYKDIKEEIGQVKVIGIYWDTWQVGVSKVFTPESEKFNKELTFL